MSEDKKPLRRRWLQYSLRTLMINVTLIICVVAAWRFIEPYFVPREPPPRVVEENPKSPDAKLMEYLLDNRETDLRCRALLENLGYRRDKYMEGAVTKLGDTSNREFWIADKKLVFHTRYLTARKQPRLLFVYDPIEHGFRGAANETIVITDAKGRLSNWKEVGAGTSFESAEFSYDKDGDPVLGLTRSSSGFGGSTFGTYGFSLAGDQIKPIGPAERHEPKKIYDEELNKWLASSKTPIDLIRWAHGCDGGVVVRKDGQETRIEAGDPVPQPPFDIGFGFSRDDKQYPLDLSPLIGQSKVYSLYLSGEAVDDRVMPVVAALTGLEDLEIADTSISDSGLALLDGKRLPNLRSLGLYGPAVNREVLTQVGTLSQLEFLKLNSETISDQDLAALSTLPRLQSLDLAAPKVTGATLPVIESLRALSWAGGALTDQGLAQIAKQPSLSGLNLQRCRRITDRGLESLGGAKSLARLAIEGTKLTGLGFAAFPRDHPLHCVNAESSRLSDEGLTALCRLNNLKALDICETTITTTGLKHLANSPSLVHLRIGGKGANDDAVPYLSKIQTLKHLVLSDVDVTEQGERTLKAMLPEIAIENAGVFDTPWCAADDHGDENNDE